MAHNLRMLLRKAKDRKPILPLVRQSISASHVTPAVLHEREQAAKLAQTVQEVMGATVGLAFVDLGYTDESGESQMHGFDMDLVVDKNTGVRSAFILLPRP